MQKTLMANTAPEPYIQRVDGGQNKTKSPQRSDETDQHQTKLTDEDHKPPVSRLRSFSALKRWMIHSGLLFVLFAIDFLETKKIDFQSCLCILCPKTEFIFF
jgi:hypothetical protein